MTAEDLRLVDLGDEDCKTGEALFSWSLKTCWCAELLALVAPAKATSPSVGRVAEEAAVPPSDTTSTA